MSHLNKFFPVHDLFTCEIIQKFDVDIYDFLCSTVYTDIIILCSSIVYTYISDICN